MHANLQHQAAAVAEKSKEYGAKGWSFLKAGYASVAAHVEHVARDNGYHVDLGACMATLNTALLHLCISSSQNGYAVTDG